MLKQVTIYAKKEKFKFDNGEEIDSLKLIAKLDNATVVLSPAKTSKDLLKFVVGFEDMEYNKEYLIYGVNAK